MKTIAANQTPETLTLRADEAALRWMNTAWWLLSTGLLALVLFAYAGG